MQLYLRYRHEWRVQTTMLARERLLNKWFQQNVAQWGVLIYTTTDKKLLGDFNRLSSLRGLFELLVRETGERKYSLETMILVKVIHDMFLSLAHKNDGTEIKVLRAYLRRKIKILGGIPTR